MKTIKNRDYSNIKLYQNSIGWINLEKFTNSTPCPICNTVLNELINKKVHDHFKNRRAQGEIDPWVCEICVQKLVGNTAPRTQISPETTKNDNI